MLTNSPLAAVKSPSTAPEIDSTPVLGLEFFLTGLSFSFFTSTLGTTIFFSLAGRTGVTFTSSGVSGFSGVVGSPGSSGISTTIGVVGTLGVVGIDGLSFLAGVSGVHGISFFVFSAGVSGVQDFTSYLLFMIILHTIVKYPK